MSIVQALTSGQRADGGVVVELASNMTNLPKKEYEQISGQVFPPPTGTGTNLYTRMGKFLKFLDVPYISFLNSDGNKGVSYHISLGAQETTTIDSVVSAVPVYDGSGMIRHQYGYAYSVYLISFIHLIVTSITGCPFFFNGDKSVFAAKEWKDVRVEWTRQCQRFCERYQMFVEHYTMPMLVDQELSNFCQRVVYELADKFTNKMVVLQFMKTTQAHKLKVVVDIMVGALIIYNPINSLRVNDTLEEFRTTLELKQLMDRTAQKKKDVLEERYGDETNELLDAIDALQGVSLGDSEPTEAAAGAFGKDPVARATSGRTELPKTQYSSREQPTIGSRMQQAPVAESLGCTGGWGIFSRRGKQDMAPTADRHKHAMPPAAAGPTIGAGPFAAAGPPTAAGRHSAYAATAAKPSYTDIAAAGGHGAQAATDSVDVDMGEAA